MSDQASDVEVNGHQDARRDVPSEEDADGLFGSASENEESR